MKPVQGPTRYLPRAELRALARIKPWRSLGSIAWTWGVIIACLAWYCASPGVLSFAVGWIVISGRHLALAILMHEGAHRLLLRNKRLNDWVSSWFTAYPIMLNVHVYRTIHLQHHRATWTDSDPDRGLARPFPITKRSFARKVARDLSGLTGLARYRLLARLSAGLPPEGSGLSGSSLWQAASRFVRVQYGFLITNLVLLLALSAADHPEAFLLLWWLPALTGYSLVLRIRSIAEHAVISDPNDELKQTRTTLAPFWLRFLIAPHNVNYHLEHHLFMFVPHYNLKKAHRLLSASGVLSGAEVAKSYLEVLKKATSRVGADLKKQRGTPLPNAG
jgi:fatty acid desaturase